VQMPSIATRNMPPSVVHASPRRHFGRAFVISLSLAAYFLTSGFSSSRVQETDLQVDFVNCNLLWSRSVVRNHRHVDGGRSDVRHLSDNSKVSRVLSHVPRQATSDADRVAALNTLGTSALTRETEPEQVFDAIRILEKARDAAETSGFKENLTGDWRLIYTTGTKKTEQEVGKVNYVPIVAVQRFEMERSFIRNGVYIGPVSIEFEGTLRWIESRRRLEFDFEELKFCGLSVPVPDFMRSTIGMRSPTPYKKQPAFDFVAADGRIIAARGAGGGVALWLRNDLAN